MCDVCWKILNDCLTRAYLILLTVASICIYTDVAKLVLGANEESEEPADV
jgi:hypothetical protein